MGNENKNNSDNNQVKFNTRYEVIDKLITDIAKGGTTQDLKGWLLKLGQDDCIEIWDGFRQLMVAQSIIEADSAVMKVTKRNTKTNNLGMAVSPMQTYRDEIITWASLAKSFDIKNMDDKHGVFKKECTININAVQNTINSPSSPKRPPPNNSSKINKNNTNYQKHVLPQRAQPGQYPHQQQFMGQDSLALKLDSITKLITDNGKAIKQANSTNKKIQETVNSNKALGEKLNDQLVKLDAKFEERKTQVDQLLAGIEDRLQAQERKQYPDFNFDNIREQVTEIITGVVTEQTRNLAVANVNAVAAEPAVAGPQGQNQINNNNRFRRERPIIIIIRLSPYRRAFFILC